MAPLAVVRPRLREAGGAVPLQVRAYAVSPECDKEWADEIAFEAAMAIPEEEALKPRMTSFNNTR